MDKLSAIEAFINVVEAGSFAAAARRLNMSRAAINQKVISLEDELGVSLFNRTTRKVDVNHAGQAYYDKVKYLIDDLRETEQCISAGQDKLSGDIRINAPLSFANACLQKVLIDFMRDYPDVNVHLILDDRKIDPLSSGFDLTIRISEPSENQAYIEHEIAPVKRHILASKKFLKQHGKIDHPAMLKTLPCLQYGNLSSGQYWRFNQNGKNQSVRVNSVLCSNNAEFLHAAALADQGIVMLPDFVVRESVETGRLLTLLEDYDLPPLVLSIVYAPGRYLAERNRVFIRYLQERLPLFAKI